MYKIQLGDKIRDLISGIEGIATSRVEYLNGCIQYGISCKVGEDGKVPEAYYVDSQQLEVVETGVVVVAPKETGAASHYGLR